MKTFFYLLISVLFLCQCQSKNQENSNFYDLSNGINTDTLIEQAEIPIFNPIDTFFDRSTIQLRLAEKIAEQKPLIVHAYIPLCDNENQGIVPTSKSLGDGMNLKTNLYWATSGGTKGFFNKQSKWKKVYNAFDIDSNVLERIVFERNYENTKVYLVADAYRGDRMEETVNDYLSAIAVNHIDSIKISPNNTIAAAGNSDLIIFNGHNGLMDNITVDSWVNKTDKRTDIVMNSCVSYGYLQKEFMLAGGYPLVRSNTLLYPGAYVLEQIIDDWVVGIDPVKLCLNAGKKYCQKHSCGAGTKVYKSGW